MTAGFLYSEDLAHWEFQPTEHLPIYDYAPDVRAVGEYLYFCASSHEEGVFYRTRDPFGDEYERIEGAFPFWDPDLFVDEDGKFYFYWGSSTTEPLYGIELDPATMQPVGEKVALCAIDTGRKGYERNGENHVPSRSKEEMERILEGLNQKNMPESMKEAARNYIMERPYMEGAWVNKHNGTYYLQYGTPSSAAIFTAMASMSATGLSGPMCWQRTTLTPTSRADFCRDAGTRFHHGGCRRFCLAYLDHAYL